MFPAEDLGTGTASPISPMNWQFDANASTSRSVKTMMLHLSTRPDICRLYHLPNPVTGQLEVCRVIDIIPGPVDHINRYRRAFYWIPVSPLAAGTEWCYTENHRSHYMAIHEIPGIRTRLRAMLPLGPGLHATGHHFGTTVCYRPTQGLYAGRVPDWLWWWNARGPYVTQGEIKSGTQLFHDIADIIDGMDFAGVPAMIVFPGLQGHKGFRMEWDVTAHRSQMFQQCYNGRYRGVPGGIPRSLLSDAVLWLWEASGTTHWTGCRQQVAGLPCCQNSTVFGCGRRCFTSRMMEFRLPGY